MKSRGLLNSDHADLIEMLIRRIDRARAPERLRRLASILAIRAQIQDGILPPGRSALHGGELSLEVPSPTVPTLHVRIPIAAPLRREAGR